MQAKINKLSQRKQDLFWIQYQNRELQMSSAWILWFFGLHYLHTKRYGLWILYILSNLIYVGWIWWIIQGIQLKSEIEKANVKIQQDIYSSLV